MRVGEGYSWRSDVVLYFEIMNECLFSTWPKVNGREKQVWPSKRSSQFPSVHIWLPKQGALWRAYVKVSRPEWAPRMPLKDTPMPLPLMEAMERNVARAHTAVVPVIFFYCFIFKAVGKITIDCKIRKGYDKKGKIACVWPRMIEKS